MGWESKDTHHKVDFEMRLAVRPERVNITVLLLELDVLLTLGEILVDPGKAYELKETTVERTLVVLLIGLYGRFLYGASAEEMAVQAAAIFQLKHIRHDRVV